MTNSEDTHVPPRFAAHTQRILFIIPAAFLLVLGVQLFFLRYLPQLWQKILEAPTPLEVARPGTVRVPIFVYHSVRPHVSNEDPFQDKFDITPELFEKQLSYLNEHDYTTITFDNLVAYFKEHKPLPPKPVILSFDDGWHNQYRYAFPLLKKYHVRATFFIFTEGIDRPHFMSWDEIKELDAAGMAIGGHTQTHPLLIAIQDPAILQSEIAGGKKIIEAHLGKPITIFAYPFGHASPRTIQAVKKAGFIAARTQYRGLYHAEADLFSLHSIQASDDFNDFLRALGE